MRRRIFALAIAALPILAGLSIAGVQIARADSGGTCIYAPGTNPIAGYPTLPSCVNLAAGRAVMAQIFGSASGNPVNSGQPSSDGVSTATISLSTQGYGYGFNGTNWDRLRAQGASSDGVGSVTQGALTTFNYNYLWNGTTWDRATAAPLTGDGVSVPGKGAAATFSGNYAYNGSTWDRLKTISALDGGASQSGILAINLVDHAGKTTATTGGVGTASLNVTTGGRGTTAIAAGFASNTVVRSTVGIVGRILVTQSGTTALTCYDSASTASGTIVALIPANATLGTVVDFQMPFTNGLTCAGNAGNPGVTISWS